MRLVVTELQWRKYFRVFHAAASSSLKGFVKNLPLSLMIRASVFIHKKLVNG
jgi:hypothetical protein